jgi:hypothetical protein
MKKFTIQESRARGNWIPRAIRFTLRDADKRIRELQKLDPKKVFRIV